MKTVLRLLLTLMPFAIFGVLYFLMKYFPSYEYNEVDIRGLYETEQSLFGIVPCQYFALHHCTFADVVAGISYLCWVPLPICFAVILFFQGKTDWCIRFTVCFLLCNIFGFCIYYLHPAAPPWYVMQYGYELRTDIAGSACGLLRFDKLTGIPVFRSIYSGNSNVFAAIPSLHAAYMLIATVYAVLSRQSRILIIAFALVTIGIWFAAVYSGHHYVIDVVLGITLAVLSVIIFEKALLRIKGVKAFLMRYILFAERK